VAVISGGRFARGLQKLLGIKGEVVIPDLDSALQAGFDIGAAVHELDFRILFGWRSYAFGITVAAVANDFLAFALSNPANSGIVAIVDRWDVNETSTFDPQIDFMRDAAIQATVNRGVVRDIRSMSGGTTASSVCSMSSGTPAAQSGTRIAKIVSENGIGAGNLAYRPVRGGGDGIVLMPGDVFAVFSATNPAGGVAGSGAIWWRERAFDPSELTA